MTARTLVHYDGTNIKAMTSAEMVETQKSTSKETIKESRLMYLVGAVALLISLVLVVFWFT